MRTATARSWGRVPAQEADAPSASGVELRQVQGLVRRRWKALDRHVARRASEELLATRPDAALGRGGELPTQPLLDRHVLHVHRVLQAEGVR